MFTRLAHSLSIVDEEPNTLSKEEVEKIFDKYTVFFNEYLTGSYKEKERVKKIGRITTEILPKL